MTIEIDLPPIDDIYIDILFKRYWNFYIIQNTASVKQHREKILSFLGEQYKKEIELWIYKIYFQNAITLFYRLRLLPNK